MLVVRGRAETVDADRAASRRLLSSAADGTSAVRVWTPHRQVAFGRRDRLREGYDRARRIARDRGFAPVERGVGGRAVAYDGETTLAFARADPVDDFRRGTDARYDRVTADVERALAGLGLDLERAEPADAFCPGAHSLSVAAPDSPAGAPPRRKIVGLAQRVRRDAALTAGIVLVDALEELAATLEAVYGALDVPLDPEAVGTVAAAGGPDDPAPVGAAIEDALVGDAPATTTGVDAFSEA